MVRPDKDEPFHDERLPLERRARMLRRYLGAAAAEYTDEMLGQVLLLTGSDKTLRLASDIRNLRTVLSEPLSEKHRRMLWRALLERVLESHRADK